MNTAPVRIVRALLSVSDKTGIEAFARGLHEKGIEIISTGGTASLLQAAKIPVVPIEDRTHFPEMMDGRVKTLHPVVHGGILGLRDNPGHVEAAAQAGIQWIDMVVCNLYPFAKTIEQRGIPFDTALENIDIGGPSMIRSAAKNLGWVAVVTDPADYGTILEELEEAGSLSYKTRRRLCASAFSHTAAYDALVQEYLCEEAFPQTLVHAFSKRQDLRYGENPHQEAAYYQQILPPAKRDSMSLSNARIRHGKELSYNNINDANGALETLREFHGNACVVVKHANPCGAAVDATMVRAVEKAFLADELSAFGGIVAMNRTCTLEIAKFLSSRFIEIVMAPDFTDEAYELLAKKRSLRILETGETKPLSSMHTYKQEGNSLLVQDRDVSTITASMLTPVTQRVCTQQETEDMLFAWKVLKHVKSNAILIAKDGTTCGIGPGQVSRVDAVRIALAKTADTHGTVLASDAFFPFRDSIDSIAGSGIKAIIQPGGSVRDQEVIDACNEHGIAMVFTGVRCFSHG